MDSPQIYYRREDEFYGTILAVAPRILRDHDQPAGSEHFPISMPEFDMFHRQLVHTQHWRVEFDFRTKHPRLGKISKTAFTNVDILVEVKNDPSAHLLVFYQEKAPAAYYMMPQKGWRAPSVDRQIHLFFTAKSDPYVLFRSIRVQTSGLVVGTPTLILFDKPQEFTLLTYPGYNIGINSASIRDAMESSS